MGWDACCLGLRDHMGWFPRGATTIDSNGSMPATPCLTCRWPERLLSRCTWSCCSTDVLQKQGMCRREISGCWGGFLVGDAGRQVSLTCATDHTLLPTVLHGACVCSTMHPSAAYALLRALPEAAFPCCDHGGSATHLHMVMNAARSAAWAICLAWASARAAASAALDAYLHGMCRSWECMG